MPGGPDMIRISILFFTGILLATGASADCRQDRQGNVRCGEGECARDVYGKIYCANAGGGAMKNRNGKVVCGVGYCAEDYLGEIWCSEKPEGGAAGDRNGEVKCLGDCAPASARLCSEAR